MMKKDFKFYMSQIPFSERSIGHDSFMLDEGQVHDVYGVASRGVALKGHPLKIMFTVIAICTGGTARIRLNLAEYELHANDVLVIRSGNIIDMAQWDADYRCVTIYLDDEGIGNSVFSDVAHHFRRDLSIMPWLLKFRPVEVEDLLRICATTRSIITNEGMAYKRELLVNCCRGIALYLMNALNRSEEQQEKEQDLNRRQQLLQTFQNLVRIYYKEQRELSFYADKMCITPKYLSIVVKQTSGRRAIDWIRDYVILEAKVMILSGEYTIQQVSDALHFANPSFFGKYFKLAVGCAPGAYVERLHAQEQQKSS